MQVGDQNFIKRLIEAGLADGIIIEVLSAVDTKSQINMTQDSIIFLFVYLIAVSLWVLYLNLNSPIAI